MAILIAVVGGLGFGVWKLGTAVVDGLRPEQSPPELADWIVANDLDDIELEGLTQEETTCMLQEMSKRFPTTRDVVNADEKTFDDAMADAYDECAI
jgi:hypothetical protein